MTEQHVIVEAPIRNRLVLGLLHDALLREGWKTCLIVDDSDDIRVRFAGPMSADAVSLIVAALPSLTAQPERSPL